jgi:hypothetical protein
MNGANNLKAGEYTLMIECPECGFTAYFPVELFGRLTSDPKGSTLRPVLATKAREHACRLDPQQDALPGLMPPAMPDYLQER